MLDTKILVVDDDPNICDLLKLYFESEGYEVKTAADVPIAKRAAPRFQ